MSAFKKLSEEENVASVLSFFFLFLPHLASSVFFMNVLLPLLFFFQAFAYVAINFPILIN